MPFETGKPYAIKELQVHSFTKCHDAADPVGFVLAYGGLRIGLVTDLGRSTLLVEDCLRGCQALVLEFNHDLQMLAEGPYPPELKRRVRGGDGHLSNEQAASLVQSVGREGLKALILAHLSETNNRPQKALRAARTALCGSNRVTQNVAKQDEPGPWVSLRM